jgi:hypothetical protein
MCGDKSHNSGMPRKSSIHFKPVSNVRFAVSHSERTDLSEPAYLLPEEHQLDNVIVSGSLSENDLAALFIQQQAGMTGQAKARGSSPFWEGVVVLPNTDSKEQSANLLEWKSAYEKTTGHKVLHMSIHLDEGYIDTAGKPQYNPHAHVIVSRMDEKNRVIKLERKELAAVQDLTAIALKMERGSTLAERGGKRGRKHVGHREYRAQADEVRLALDVEKDKSLLEGRLTDGLKIKLDQAQVQTAKVPQLELHISTQATEIARLNEQYRLARQELKDSGKAKQADYQALKKEHEATLAKLATVQAVADRVPALEAKVAEGAKVWDSVRPTIEKLSQKVETMIEENQILKAENAKLEADKVRFAAMAGSYQEHTAQGKDPELFVPAAPKAAKAPIEAPKAQTQPIPLPKPEKSLVERLGASFRAFVDWVKVKGGFVDQVDTQHSEHHGPVVQLDDLHAVQNTGRGKFAVHQLDRLDKLPALDDPRMEIRYRDGVGSVKGQTLDRTTATAMVEIGRKLDSDGFTQQQRQTMMTRVAHNATKQAKDNERDNDLEQ